MSRYEIEVNIEARNRASKEFKQLERDINKVQRESGGATQATGRFGASLGGLTTAAIGAVSAFGAMEIARFGIEMAQAGEQVRNTSNRFRDLVGGTDQVAGALGKLRKATQGMVTDTELMAGASRLLQMGIASSVDDAARLVEIAIALKQPMDSASDAIQNLSLMIANASYERLDSLGLSATEVRNRVNELKEEGMGLQEAFAQAVIEQAADAMDTLAESTEEAQTNMGKLAVQLGNVGDALQGVTFDLGEAIAGGILSGGFAPRGTSGIQAQIRAEQDALERLENAEERAALARAQRETERELQEQRRVENAENRVSLATNFAQQESAAIRRQEEERLRHLDATYRAQERFFRLQTAAAAREMRSLAFATGREFDTLDQQFERIYERGIINEQFYRPQALAPLNAFVDRYEQVLVEAERLHERGIIDDQQLRAYEQSTRSAQQVLRSAESQARAFQNVSLSTLMGEVSGGAASEIGVLVSVDLIDNQLADEFTKELQRLTGERTVLTDYMEDTLVPMVQSVTEEYGAEAGAKFAYGLNAEMMAGLDAGLSPQQVVDMIKSKLGFEYNFDEPITITVPAMVTWSNVIAQGLPEIIDEETGEALDQDAVLAIIEERLGLEEGVITSDTDRAIKYSLAGTEITIGDIADATGIAEEQLAGLMFNDPNNRTVDMTQPLSINLHSVGWGQVLDATGLTTQALLAQLPEEAVSIINGTPFIKPGQYQIAPLTPIQQGAGGTIPGMMQQGYELGQPVDPLASVANTGINQLGTMFTQLAQDATTVQQQVAETDFETMAYGAQLLGDETQEAYDNLTTLVDTEWVATVALDFVILDGTKWGQLPGFTNAVQDIMRSTTRDNGGVPVGANQGSMRQGG